MQTEMGLWKKGSATMLVAFEGEGVRITPTIGSEFRVHVSDWIVRMARLQDEGWAKEDSEFIEDEETTGVQMRSSDPKIKLPSDTVLRRDVDGQLYLMTRQEGGWESFAHPVESEAWVTERFNVRLGIWSQDKYGDFCPVTKVTHRMVSKPPRPGDRKIG